MDGGGGVDLLSYEDAISAVIVSVSVDGFVLMDGAATGDVVTSVEAVRGSEFDDVLSILSSSSSVHFLDGGAGNDSLVGSSDHETLIGGSGNDTVFGGSGNDTIRGGEGLDALFGGTGSDTFVFEDGDVPIVSDPTIGPFETIVGF